MKRPLRGFTVCAVSLVVAACGSDRPVLSISDEAPGPNCAHGGSKLEAGRDKNKNGLLDPREVESTLYVCDGEPGPAGPPGPVGPPGEDGKQVLIDVDEEPPGANCANGGRKVSTGLDEDSDGSLDPD